MDKNKYPLLNKYLEYNKKIKLTAKKDEDKERKDKTNKIKNNDSYSLDNLDLFNKVLNLISEKYSHKITREFAEKCLIKDTEIYQNSENAIDNFIKFYNQLKMTDNNGKEIQLKVDKHHLSDFVLDNNNEIGKTYKDIYAVFIKKQNEEIEELLDLKIMDGIFNSNCTNRINVQQIKEDEIFTFNIPDKFSFIDVIFNSSYRKVIDTKNYKNYNQFEINFNDIEANMTELLLKNKKLINEDIIIEFSYNNEIFDNEVTDLIMTFKNYYNITNMSLDDKEVFYNFVMDNKGNLDKYKYIINDFITLLQYLNNIKKEEKENYVKEGSLIYDVVKNIEDSISPDFLKIFEGKKELSVNKTSDIFNYYLQLIFNDAKGEIEKYQKENEDKMNQLDEKTIKQLDSYFEKEKIIINKEVLENAIQLFITLVLFREKDKENKIKSNRKNLIDYLKSPDLWDNIIYKDEKFNQNLNELKRCNIKINQTLWLYNYLVGNRKFDVFKEIEQYIKSKPNPVKVPQIDNINTNEEESEHDSN